MEKRRILADASGGREMRAVRNAIAHEYRQEIKSLQALFGAVHDHSGTLLEIAENLERYAQALVNAGP